MTFISISGLTMLGSVSVCSFFARLFFSKLSVARNIVEQWWFSSTLHRNHNQNIKWAFSGIEESLFNMRRWYKISPQLRCLVFSLSVKSTLWFVKSSNITSIVSWMILNGPFRSCFSKNWIEFYFFLQCKRIQRKSFVRISRILFVMMNGTVSVQSNFSS